MREIPPGLRVALLATSALVLFAAVATFGTREGPYAPNDWLFSHVYLADLAVEHGEIPLNEHIATRNSFAETKDGFQDAVGLDRMTFYATTVWHFWNGLPLHPSLVATLSLLTDAAPEEVSRLPLGGLAVVLLAFASADLLLSRLPEADGRFAVVAPLLLALACTPLALDLRVLMPSTSVVLLALAAHLLLRRTLLDDRGALVLGLAPLALLPLWYYTVSYFVMLVFAGFVLSDLVLWRRKAARPVVPLAAATLVPLALAGMLTLNGALTSHVNMAQQIGGSWIAPDAGSDYTQHLNRDPWRSALLYAELGALFAPLAWISGRAAVDLLRSRPLRPDAGFFAQWAVGGVLFTLLLQATVGVSFLNRTVIYFAPIVVLAATASLARLRRGAPVAVVGLGAALVVTAALVGTATPRYAEADREAFEWMDASVSHDAVVYAPLDVASVLFREYGFHDVLAFHPRTALLDDLWYGTDEDAMVVYLASFEWLVLRDDVKHAGFEEFGPLREPVSEAAWAKFGASDDLDLLYASREVQVFRVHLTAERLRPASA